MNRMKAFFTALILAVVFSIAGYSEELTIVVDGNSDHVIAMPEQSKDPAKFTEAAQYLIHDDPNSDSCPSG